MSSYQAFDWGYISSGTWSLVGVELSQPVMTPEALAANFTNEGGVSGTTRFLKNVIGLWLLQECQRRWMRDGHVMGYDTLLADVDAVPLFAALIDPDDERFLAPVQPGSEDGMLNWIVSSEPSLLAWIMVQRNEKAALVRGDTPTSV